MVVMMMLLLMMMRRDQHGDTRWLVDRKIGLRKRVLREGLPGSSHAGAATADPVPGPRARVGEGLGLEKGPGVAVFFPLYRSCAVCQSVHARETNSPRVGCLGLSIVDHRHRLYPIIPFPGGGSRPLPRTPPPRGLRPGVGWAPPTRARGLCHLRGKEGDDIGYS